MGPLPGPAAGLDGLQDGLALLAGLLGGPLEFFLEADLDGPDDPVLLLRLELELPGQADDADDQPAAGEAVADEGPDLDEAGAEGAELLDLGQDFVTPRLEAVVGEFLFRHVEQLDEGLGVLLEHGLEGGDLVEREGRPGQGLEDGLLAALHPAGQRDLLLPGQEQDAAHLAEVDLDQVGGLLDVLRRVQGFPAAAVLGLAEPGVERGRAGRREDLFLVGKELAPGGVGYELKQLFVVLVLVLRSHFDLP
ncbi:MAG: hypothetical protein H6P96_600 [Candidatus Aminicenantes bacterium]|nr:hypothetical protein [Candidatus Aminicenantes bacterium]